VVNSTGIGSYGSLNSLTKSFSITADTAADTATFTDMQFGVLLTGGRTTTRNISTVTPPTSFPDLPTVTTATFVETVTFDPISPLDLAPELVSSTTAAIRYARGAIYSFPTNVVLTFPNSGVHQELWVNWSRRGDFGFWRDGRAKEWRQQVG
jgi:hypothetical protein